MPEIHYRAEFISAQHIFGIVLIKISTSDPLPRFFVCFSLELWRNFQKAYNSNFTSKTQTLIII